MKILFPLFLTLLFCLYYLDAFFLPALDVRLIGGDRSIIVTIRSKTSDKATTTKEDHDNAHSSSSSLFAKAAVDHDDTNAPKDVVTSQPPQPHPLPASPKPFTHADVVWKLRPPPEYPWWRRLRWRLACRALRLTYLLQGRRQQLPTVLCPGGGRAQLECYFRSNINNRPQGRTNSNNNKKKLLAKFGITTQSGPSIPQIQETVADLYRTTNPAGLLPVVSTAAIIYMYVEPEHRGRQLGALALEVISFIHASQNIDFTVLVANDKTTKTTQAGGGAGDEEEQKLVKWYQQHGYQRAPKLQKVFGSPNAIYGVTMIAPTNNTKLPENCTIQWW